jgi:hypothetical protein
LTEDDDLAMEANNAVGVATDLAPVGVEIRKDDYFSKQEEFIMIYLL